MVDAADAASWLVSTTIAMLSSGSTMFSAVKPETSPLCSICRWPAIVATETPSP